MNDASIHPEQPRPFRNRVALPVDFQKAIPALIVGLLGPGCPGYVIRLVIPVVIDPIKRAAARPLSHVLQECREAIPARANPNTSATVIGIGLVARIVATLEHHEPNGNQRMPEKRFREASHAASLTLITKGIGSKELVVSCRLARLFVQYLRLEPFVFPAVSSAGIGMRPLTTASSPERSVTRKSINPSSTSRRAS